MYCSEAAGWAGACGGFREIEGRMEEGTYVKVDLMLDLGCEGFADVSVCVDWREWRCGEAGGSVSGGNVRTGDG